LGWIAAGISIGIGGPWFCGASIELTAYPMRIGAVAMAALAFVCSIVPDVHVARPVGGFSWTEVRLLAGRSEIWRLLVIALLTSIAPQFYGNYGNVYFNALEIRYAAAKLTLGQVAEVIGILALPSLLARFRAKSLILAGLAMWALRYALLAWVDGPEQTWAVFLAVALHGASFPLASIPLQLEMHRRASDAYRATGQGLLLIAMSGVGALAGASLAGLAEVNWLSAQTLGLGAGLGGRWELFWGAPAVGTLLVMGVVVWLWERRDRPQAEKSAEPEKNAGIVLSSGYTPPCP
jgi:hypothetical protein